MNEEQLRQLLNEEYDRSRELTFGSIVKDFYNKKMKSVVILIWGMALVFIAIAVFLAIQFAHTADTKMLILYATLFLVMVHWVDLLKIFAWQMIHRNNIRREIKRLELRIMELNESVNKQS